VSQGWNDAVERLYRSDGARLWRSLLAFTADPDVAGDAESEAFAQLLRRGEAVREPGAWVWRAAFRIAAGELKERQRMEGEGGAMEQVDPPEPSDLLAALRRLSPNQRGSVVLHHYAGYPVRDVAAILGSTTAAVRVHLSQGRKRLRALLAEDNEVEAEGSRG
jgi:RNA polymerase sigma-70 factor, ECF subfamily